MAQAISPHSFAEWTDPFAKRTVHGLFSAPWLERPCTESIAEVEQLSEALRQTPHRRDDLSVVLGHLLAVHGHCQRAARSRDPHTSRRHYHNALQECEAVLARLYNAKGGTPAALAAWALGVHTLIRAQVAMATNPTEARMLAFEALNQLSGPADPLVAGAEADALSAIVLAREPAELTGRLANLPDQVRAAVDKTEQKLSLRAAALNRAVRAVRRSHQEAMAWVVGWGALNLTLMATGPINSFFAPSVPWSLPFLLGLLLLWWATWAVPFRKGLPFYAYVRMLRTESIGGLRAAAGALPDPRPEVESAVRPLLEAGQRDHERLSLFHLYHVPAEADTCWKARAIAEGATERLSGEWMAEMIDRPPVPLAEVLPTEPSRIPGIIRVWFGPTGD